MINLWQSDLEKDVLHSQVKVMEDNCNGPEK